MQRNFNVSQSYCKWAEKQKMNVVCSEYGYYHPYYEYRDEYFDETSPKAPETGKQNIENEFK